MSKMDKKWIVLCSAAVGAIYAGGWFATQAQASMQQQAQPSAVEQSGQANQRYVDGTYTGMGRNRRGSIQVAVTVKNDKITDVEITDFAMHYSERDVVGLPDEVLQLQSAQVDNVSGATYSTMAFADAVQEALNQARMNP